MKKKPQDPRRLLVLFVITTLVPAASLAWLAWRIIEQDRLLEDKQTQERRNQAADLAASALQRLLAEAEEKLTTFSTSPASPPANIRDGETLAVLTRSGIVQRAGAPLPYYPAVSSPPPPAADQLTAADNLEFRNRDLPGALRLLVLLAHTGDPALRAEAVVRIARIHRKAGDITQALDAYSTLASFDPARAAGLPAGLRALQGRALIFESSGRPDELHREAAALARDLENGRWMLSRAEFDFAYGQAHDWLGTPHTPPLAERLALADAMDSLWRTWRVRDDLPPTSRERRSFRSDDRSGDRSVLILTRSSPDRITALMIGRQFLESAWLAQLPSANVQFALTDADGRPVLGSATASLSLQSIRPASATQLPWTVHAIDRGKAPGSPEISARTRLLLAGIAMMTLILLAGGYFINRAVLREITVARLQSDFVAAVSHEFRTPLTTLRQLSEMLVRGRVSNDDRRQQFYETLLRESERLHRLVEGLLNFGAMEAGELRYRFEPVDPGAFVREIVSDFEREVSALGYHIELAGSGDLPSIRADRESLARVFWNLLDNAVKYSPDNRTVWVDLSNAGKRLMVRVRDLGIGIPAAEQKDIFRKFVRGAASKSASIRGTGVGLAMARQIVAAHGGDISVESEPGKGSVFTVLLPVMET
jgi:signal transduction histidine kinase